MLCEKTSMCGSRDNGCEGCGICIDICIQKRAFFKEAYLNGDK